MKKNIHVTGRWAWTGWFACGMLLAGSPIAQAKISTSCQQKAILGDPLASWERQEIFLQSPHPIPTDTSWRLEIQAPETASKFRIQFKHIVMEKGADTLILSDEWGSEIERITGVHRDYVSRPIFGTKAVITQLSDTSTPSWGFVVNKILHRGCEHNLPGPSTLRSFASCGELRQAIAERATAQVRERFTMGGYYFGRMAKVSAPLEAAASNASAPAHSETTVQVAGVDEADVVKTDGHFTYYLRGHELLVYKTWPADASALVHQIPIQGQGQEMFLDGNRVIILSQVWETSYSPHPGGPLFFKMMPFWWRSESFTRVTVLEMSGAPKVVDEHLFAGDYVSSRRIEGSVRLVLRRNLSFPEIRYQSDEEVSETDQDRVMAGLEQEALQQVEDRALSDWLPQSYRLENGRRVPLPVDCQDIYISEDSQELGMTSVVTLDLSRRTPLVQETSILVNAQEMVQFPESLYLTSSHQYSCYRDANAYGDYTYVHQLDIGQRERSRVLASGGFEGRINDQFSMDEYQGNLRVATTTDFWNQEDPALRTRNRVYVLSRKGKELKLKGQVELKAPGERIMSARFVGNRGFVVTFRQVDPLFTLDLSDPFQPKVVGELKIPGFSTYLHVLDDNHLFAIGNDFADDGTTRNGVALSVYDVTDLSRARLTHKAVVGTRNGYSEALWEHKAFTLFRRPGEQAALLAIPFTDWTPPTGDGQAYDWGQFKSTLKVFRVSPLGILGLGEVDHSGLYQENQVSEWSWWYQPSIRRGVFVEDHVYAFSDAGLKVARLDDLKVTAEVPVAWNPEPKVEEPLRVSAGDKANLWIPDNEPEGVTGELYLADDVLIQGLEVRVNLEHGCRKDLKVVVLHDGLSETLQNRTGCVFGNLEQQFCASRFRGLSSRGTWLLAVSDLAKRDEGRLLDWEVIATGQPIKGSLPALPQVRRAYLSSKTPKAASIPTSGVLAEVEVPEGLRVGRLQVQAELTEPLPSNLRLALVRDGQEILLRRGLSLGTPIDVPELQGQDLRGRWQLRQSSPRPAGANPVRRLTLLASGEPR